MSFAAAKALSMRSQATTGCFWYERIPPFGPRSIAFNHASGVDRCRQECGKGFRAGREGWNFKHVFSGGNGVINAVTQDNRLLWYRHTGAATGQSTWAPHLPVAAGRLDGQIGEGWDFKHVFSGGNGVIYAVTNDNRLLWYRHTGFADGRDAWAPHLPGARRAHRGADRRRVEFQAGLLGWRWRHIRGHPGQPAALVPRTPASPMVARRRASHLPVPAGHLDGQIGGGWDFKHVFSRPT